MFFLKRTDIELYATAKMTSSGFTVMATGNINMAYCFDSQEEATNWWNQLQVKPIGEYEVIKI